MKLRPLPPIAADLLDTVLAPPRLVAHLTLVHDVAAHLVPAFQRAFPALVVDEGAVFLGAATHDIGKALAPSELSEPGKTHERLGEDLLLRHGIVPSLARFARTHGLPVGCPDERRPARHPRRHRVEGSPRRALSACLPSRCPL